MPPPPHPWPCEPSALTPRLKWTSKSFAAFVLSQSGFRAHLGSPAVLLVSPSGRLLCTLHRPVCRQRPGCCPVVSLCQAFQRGVGAHPGAGVGEEVKEGWQVTALYLVWSVERLVPWVRAGGRQLISSWSFDKDSPQRPDIWLREATGKKMLLKYEFFPKASLVVRSGQERMKKGEWCGILPK